MTADILNTFLKQWPLKTIKKMTLKEYVGIRNQNTFCQWVETKTSSLGSIKGMNSLKFGIYQRINPEDKLKNYHNDSSYSWMKRFGKTRQNAFEQVRNCVVKTIECAQKGDFETIDEIQLQNLFKWKIAFLYSNQRLIPVFRKTVLESIYHHYSGEAKKSMIISKVQDLMMKNKPSHLNVHEFMHQLYKDFGSTRRKKQKTKSRKNKRRAATTRNTSQHHRSGSSSVVVQQLHNKIQEELEKRLIAKYGKRNVILEEDYVDLKLKKPGSFVFYEVKSAAHASDCIKEALGQVLSYAHFHNKTESKPVKKIIVVGQNEPNKHDREFIQFIKKRLKVDFAYESVDVCNG